MGGVGKATPIITNIELKSCSDLTKIVKTARGSRLFGNPACGGKPEGCEYCNNGHNGQQFDQSEGWRFCGKWFHQKSVQEAGFPKPFSLYFFGVVSGV
jgi:hypothetical protein